MSTMCAKKYTHFHNLLHGLRQIGTICLAIFLSVSLCLASGVSPTATTADCDNATLSTYSGTTNLQANWEPNTIDITWYNGNDVFATNSCVYDDILTLPSGTPTKTGYTFDGWRVRGLPEGYTKLEYIQTSGTQWIDTGIVPNQDSRASMVMMATYAIEGTIRNAYAGGAYGGSSWSDNSFGFYGAAASGSPIFFNYKTDTSTSITMQANSKYIFELDKNKFYLNGNLVKTVSATTFTAHESFRIGMLHLPFSSDRYLIGRVYSFSMWDNGTLVRNMIPAKNSSNVVGMYDTVSQTFFTNAGTGSFTAGPDAI